VKGALVLQRNTEPLEHKINRRPTVATKQVYSSIPYTVGSEAASQHAATDASLSCWLWLAQYGPTAVVPPNWSTWTLWQYTDGNVGPEPRSVPGVGGCDRDQFNGDENALRDLWGF
jgi:GH25 family lysozyme M1 (1,4-beta-N-acetylmuramidase)